MNIQNIAELSKQLEVLGFHDAGSLLLKRICFKPADFFLPQRVIKEKDILLFSLYFERLQKTDNYQLQYYDVTLQKANGGLVLPVDGVNPAELEKQMAGIDWKKAFSLDDKKLWNAEEKSTWETELRISDIIGSLSILEKSEQGKVIASVLKQKFWTGTLHLEIVGSLPLVKNKADVSQRFYIAEDGSGITTDEAYRFLQNKYMEKQLQLKRKQSDNGDESIPEESNGTSSSGLLKKKRISGKGKRNRVNQD
ncbi:MAG: hypothetical protein ACRCSM_09925 [Sediminibacterium sp.]|jgi:hypothetical protein|nr:hypothetical protein [Asinibacterium sp. OR53]MBR2647979.1 hypothetical protein [Sediminibacterium sp.]MCA6441634.1 hypothetical protein [Chitinophagaceae bacterium]MCA6447023.1 hypothetical protein [Chitinophagaceae bacterium]